MALYHFAYTFNSDDFHKDLKSRIIKEGVIDVYKLQQEARFLVLNASDEMKRILDDLIRYDDEWLDETDRNASDWYLINLVSVFNHCPSLSNNRFHYSHYILERVLPLAGWGEEEIRAIIFGKPLRVLLENTEYQVLLTEFTLRDGCLGNTDIASILTHLKSSEDYFSPQSSESKDAIKIFSEHNTMKPEDILSSAYMDAIEMLETALKRNEALYLARDA